FVATKACLLYGRKPTDPHHLSPMRSEQPSLHRVRRIENRAPTDNTIRLAPGCSDQSTGGYPDMGRHRAYAIRAQHTKPCLLRSQHSYVVSVEPRTRLLGHTDPWGQRTSRSSTASTIKLGVHATMIPSKNAWISSMTYPL